MVLTFWKELTCREKCSECNDILKKIYLSDPPPCSLHRNPCSLSICTAHDWPGCFGSLPTVGSINKVRNSDKINYSEDKVRNSVDKDKNYTMMEWAWKCQWHENRKRNCSIILYVKEQKECTGKYLDFILKIINNDIVIIICKKRKGIYIYIYKRKKKGILWRKEGKANNDTIQEGRGQVVSPF
jgi:hypothetical protein